LHNAFTQLSLAVPCDAAALAVVMLIVPLGNGPHAVQVAWFDTVELFVFSVEFILVELM
jgi:hypothetical protein